MVVVVLESQEKLWVCVDLKPINQSVLKEVHPLPQVDDALPEPNIFEIGWQQRVLAAPTYPLIVTFYIAYLSPYILRFHLHLNRISDNIKHVHSKELHTTDVLSRAPLPTFS